jgi:single-strand DNA-binding protein
MQIQPKERTMLTTTATFEGRLTGEPDLRYTNGGTAVAEFRVLVNQRVKDGEQWIDAEPTAHNVKIFGFKAEDVAESLTKGTSVIVVGRVQTEMWPDKSTGEKRTADRVIVDNRYGTVGISLPRAPKAAQKSRGDEAGD